MRRLALFSLLTVALAGQTAPKPEPPKETQAPLPAQAPAATPSPATLSKPTPGPRPATPPPAKEEVVPEDQVIARIGKRIILEKDFLEWLKAAAGKRFEQISKMPGGLTRARQQYLDIQVLSAKARKERVQNSADFKKLMKVQEDQALVNFMMNEERDGSEGQRMKAKAENPTEDEIKAYFEKNAQRFETPEKFTARHILVGLKGAPRVGDKGLTEEEAKARIAKIQEELKAGKSFEDLAKEYSDDPGSKTTGGLYKDMQYGAFAKEFQDAVRQQEVGKVGEPVKTMYGYHLILVEGRTPKQPAEFESTKERVKQQMLPERRESLRKDFLDEARKEIDFVAGSDAAASLPKGTPAKTKKK